MSETSDTPSEPTQFRHKEYEDPHFHDEDEVAPVTDDEHRSPRKVTNRGKEVFRKLVQRRRYQE